MKTVDVLKSPYWLADIALGGKSFRKNPLIGSPRLNERGLHVRRMELAEKMAAWRRKRMHHLLPPHHREFFEEKGYLALERFLPNDLFQRMKAEVHTTKMPAWEMKQGRTVTRFIPLPPSVLKGAPALSKTVWNPVFQGGLRYIAGTNGNPIVYLHTVLSNPEEQRADPQTQMHSDTFHPTSKAWLFLDDVEMEDGPFLYVPGSHRLTDGRRKWEYEQSLSAAHHQNVLHAVGSFRTSMEEAREMGFGEPVAMTVPANTLVIADTHGFHARGVSTRPCVRMGLYGSLRRNPFLPWVGLDLASLPLVKSHQAFIFLRGQDLSAKWKGKDPSHVFVGEVLASTPAVRRETRAKS